MLDRVYQIKSGLEKRIKELKLTVKNPDRKISSALKNSGLSLTRYILTKNTDICNIKIPTLLRFKVFRNLSSTTAIDKILTSIDNTNQTIF